ncbi:hypothetical protein KIH23_09550 [Flavobacterium sp. CYK-55]|uniref:hypothetical protein n=1 Tax=Flavobacterium sp. CYK-55 TaxID=2835529 RepID=UPI001BCCD307|nr:hypothetical protein [Flavobacterium sp. CYK-55]MBS7787539.1 hypothetical protein [Flavobacterium sp. CYK-55]
MSLKKLHPVLFVVFASVLGYALHKVLFYFIVPQKFEADFVYSVEMLYAFFAVSSALIVSTLNFISKKSVNNVGYFYLLLTTLKMGVAYFFLKPILSFDLPKTAVEKTNFFLIFIYFLIVETVVTIRILNKKQ